MEGKRVLPAPTNHGFNVDRRAMVPRYADYMRPQRGAMSRNDIPVFADQTDLCPGVGAFAAIGGLAVHELISKVEENLFE